MSKDGKQLSCDAEDFIRFYKVSYRQYSITEKKNPAKWI